MVDEGRLNVGEPRRTTLRWSPRSRCRAGRLVVPSIARPGPDGLGIDLATDWILQNPIFNGYAGILAYLPSQRISILIENTHGSNAAPNTSISAEIFKAVTAYLTPNDPI